MTPHREIPDFNSTRVELLTTELDVGHTFASIALATANQETRSRNRFNARKAYDIAVAYADNVALTRVEVRKVKIGLSRPKSELKLLGETGLG